MAVEKEVGIIVTGEDRNASAVLKKVGAEGSKNMEKLRGTVKAMPEQFGKMSGALQLFQSGMGQTGGKVADAANKISALVGLVAVGGPLGIGIAAVTAAVAGASAVLEAYTADTKAAEEAQKSIDRALSTSAVRIQEVKGHIKSLSDEIRFYGQESLSVAIQKQQEMIAANESGVASITKEIEAIEWTTRAFSKKNSEEMRHLENLIRIKKNAEAMLTTRREELSKLNELNAKQKKENEERERAERVIRRKAAAEKRAAAAAREAAAAAREADEAERKRQETIRKSIALINERYSLEDRIERGLIEVRMANLQRIAEAESKEMAARQKAMNSYAASAQEAFGIVTNVLVDFNATASDKFKSMLSSTLSLAGRMVAEYVASVILSNAAKGASEAAAQSMSIPGIGIALAPAAATSAFATIAGLVAMIPAFEKGGMVGRTGMATVHEGERVVDAKRTSKLNEWIDNLREIPSQSSSDRTTVVLNMNAQIGNPEEMTDAQIKRWLVRISKPAEELFRDGLFLRSVRAR